MKPVPFRSADFWILLFLGLFALSSAFSIALTQIGYFGALAIWAGRMVVRREWEVPRTPLDPFFLWFAGAEVLAMLFAEEKLYALLYLQRRLLLIPIVYIMARFTAEERINMRLLALLAGSAVGVALYSFGPIVMHLADFLQFRRRLGEFQIYMTAGGISMTALLVMIPFVLHERTPRRVRLWTAAAVVPVLVSLVFTFTRSSWLGFLAGILVIGFKRTRKIFYAALALVALVYLLATPELREQRLHALVDPSHPANATRLHMWQVGWRSFLDHPVTGIGDVGVETVWDRYAEPGWGVEGHLHNNLMMWLVTLGIAGTTGLIGLFVLAWIVIARFERQVRGEWYAGSLGLGVLAAMAGFHVNGLFEWNFGDTEIIMILWALIGLALGARVGKQHGGGT
jgi:O-antigen ligase